MLDRYNTLAELTSSFTYFNLADILSNDIIFAYFNIKAS